MDITRKIEADKNITVHPGERFSYGVTTKEGIPTRGWLKVSSGKLVRFYLLPSNHGKIHPSVITLIGLIRRDLENGHIAKYFWRKYKEGRILWIDVGHQERHEHGIPNNQAEDIF